MAVQSQSCKSGNAAAAVRTAEAVPPSTLRGTEVRLRCTRLVTCMPTFVLSWFLFTFLDQVLKPLGRRHTAAVIKDVELPNADGLMVLDPLPQILILVLHAQADCKVGLPWIPHNLLCRDFWGQGFLIQDFWITCRAKEVVFPSYILVVAVWPSVAG